MLLFRNTNASLVVRLVVEDPALAQCRLEAAGQGVRARIAGEIGPGRL
jgi:hypothetical protein